jgi:hypothetical protein
MYNRFLIFLLFLFIFFGLSRDIFAAQDVHETFTNYMSNNVHNGVWRLNIGGDMGYWSRCIKDCVPASGIGSHNLNFVIREIGTSTSKAGPYTVRWNQRGTTSPDFYLTAEVGHFWFNGSVYNVRLFVPRAMCNICTASFSPCEQCGEDSDDCSCCDCDACCSCECSCGNWYSSSGKSCVGAHYEENCPCLSGDYMCCPCHDEEDEEDDECDENCDCDECKKEEEDDCDCGSDCNFRWPLPPSLPSLDIGGFRDPGNLTFTQPTPPRPFEYDRPSVPDKSSPDSVDRRPLRFFERCPEGGIPHFESERFFNELREKVEDKIPMSWVERFSSPSSSDDIDLKWRVEPIVIGDSDLGWEGLDIDLAEYLDEVSGLWIVGMLRLVILFFVVICFIWSMINLLFYSWH